MAKCFICGKNVGLFDGKCHTLEESFVCEECLANAGIPIAVSTRIEVMRDEKIRSYLEGRNGIEEIFTPTDAVEDFIEADEKHRLIRVNQDYYLHIVAIDEIVGFDIVEDGMTVTTGGLGSAVAGGLLFGKAGAIAGATLGRKKAKDVCTSLNVIIILKDSYLENLTIRIIDGEISHHSAKYVAGKQVAKKCIELLERVIKMPNSDGEEKREVTEGKNHSAVEEILQFKQLLDDGIITQEEFDFQKKKLLGMLN